MDYRTLAHQLEESERHAYDGNPLDRIRALEATKRLQSRLETPWESLIRMAWLEVPLTAVLKIAIDLSIFKSLQSGPRGLHDLSAVVGAEADFLRRVLRLLAAYKFLDETSTEAYSLTKTSQAIANEPSMRAAVNYMSDVLVPVHARLPEYCQSRKYRNPRPTDEVWRMVSGEDMTFYDWLLERPEKAANFQTLLTGYASDRPTWTTFYPIEELLRTWRDNTALVVDVGGGRGQDLRAILELHRSDMKGALILQDLPEVIEMAKKTGLDSRITPMAHDFFTTQPVKGARVYHLHLVLLNWPDEKALLILEGLKPALTPSYSRILINDNVCIPGKSHVGAPAMDIVMMGVFNGKVRSKDEWTALVDKAGLVVWRFWSIPEVPENIIEVGLLDEGSHEGSLSPT